MPITFIRSFWEGDTMKGRIVICLFVLLFMASYAMLMVSHYGALLFLGSGLAFGYYMLFIRDPSCFRHQVDTNFTHRVIIYIFVSLCLLVTAYYIYWL